jgi:hypothetical protein
VGSKGWTEIEGQEKPVKGLGKPREDPEESEIVCKLFPVQQYE